MRELDVSGGAVILDQKRDLDILFLLEITYYACSPSSVALGNINL